MMDANLSAEMLADAQAICAESGQAVVIAGVTYAAMISDPTVTPQLVEGGLMEQVSILVKVPATSAATSAKANFQPGKKLTFDGRTYRVTALTSKPGSAWYQMQCQDADQR